MRDIPAMLEYTFKILFLKRILNILRKYQIKKAIKVIHF